MVAHVSNPPSHTGEAHRPQLLLRYPGGWLLIVLVPALAVGFWLGVTHHNETIDFQVWWLLPGCGAVALEGVFGGWLFGDHQGLGQMAGIGAVCSWISFGVSVSVSATGSVDPGGFGWPEATVVMSAILFVPMLLGAGVGSQLRHARAVDESEQLVKVLVRLAPDADRKTEHWWVESEALWALPAGDDAYELRNIPWETEALHHRDIVRCRRSEDGSLHVVDVLKRSGHATLRITFADAATVNGRAKVIQQLEALVGSSEKISDEHWAFDINPSGDRDRARALVSELEQDRILAKSAVT